MGVIGSVVSGKPRVASRRRSASGCQPGATRSHASEGRTSRLSMNHHSRTLAETHPYPVQPLRRFPRYIQLVELAFWGGIIFPIMWRTGSMFWPFVAGCVVNSVVWILICTRFRCPKCRQAMTSRTETDDNETDHLFYDCARCQITYDPQFAEGSCESDSGVDDM